MAYQLIIGNLIVEIRDQLTLNYQARDDLLKKSIVKGRTTISINFFEPINLFKITNVYFFLRFLHEELYFDHI